MLPTAAPEATHAEAQSRRPIIHLPPVEEEVTHRSKPEPSPVVHRRDTPIVDLEAAPRAELPPTREQPIIEEEHEVPSDSEEIDLAHVPTLNLPAAREEAHRQVLSSDVIASPASLWRRCFAWLVDLTLVGTVVGGFFAAALAVIGTRSPAALLNVLAPALGVTGFVAFVYGAVFAFLWNGRTPGRRVVGIHLVDSTGQAPGPVRALVRALLSIASFALFLSGFWLALFDRKGQTLHDKLTSTFVVRLRPAS